MKEEAVAAGSQKPGPQRRWSWWWVLPLYGVLIGVLLVLSKKFGVDLPLSPPDPPVVLPARVAPPPADPVAGAAYVDGWGQRFRWVPGGRYVLGSGDQVQEEMQGPRPLHHAEIAGVWLAETEVTQAFWIAQGLENPSTFKGCKKCPVETVGWYEAVAFANLLSRRAGLDECYEQATVGRPGRKDFLSSLASLRPACSGYRLPSEAEWEAGARAEGPAKRNRYRYGQPDEIAWFKANSGNRPHEVATKSGNEWRLYDMLGNVFEWTGDEHGPRRAVRGGHYQDESGAIVAHNRYQVGVDLKVRGVGFRLALDSRRAGR